MMIFVMMMMFLRRALAARGVLPQLIGGDGGREADPRVRLLQRRLRVYLAVCGPNREQNGVALKSLITVNNSRSFRFLLRLIVQKRFALKLFG